MLALMETLLDFVQFLISAAGSSGITEILFSAKFDG